MSEALVGAGGYSPLSLDVPTQVDSSLSLGEVLRDEGDPYAMVDRAEWLRPALARAAATASARARSGTVQLQFVRKSGR